MYVPAKLKLNKFRLVQIPENRDYFSRYGFLQSPSSAYGGDNDLPPSSGMTKIEDIEAGRQYDALKQREEAEKE